MAELDRDALIAWLQERAQEAPVGDAPLLVLYSIYQGLVTRIESGQFDKKGD